MAEFYHIMLDVPGRSPADEEITKIFDRAVHWYRYSNNCWIVYTSSDAAKWYERFSPLVRANAGKLFIVKLDLSDRQGWINKSLWDWIRERTHVGSGEPRTSR